MTIITEFPFVEQIESEAMVLLLEARNALTDPAARAEAETDPATRWVATRGNFEVTARLSWVVAWVNFQKAARAGEMTQDEAYASHPPLDMDDAPDDPDASNVVQIPAALQDRLDRSRALYDRTVGFGSSGVPS